MRDEKEEAQNKITTQHEQMKVMRMETDRSKQDCKSLKDEKTELKAKYNALTEDHSRATAECEKTGKDLERTRKSMEA